MKNNWICTDPDNKQYGRKIAEGIYEFKERNPFHEFNDEGEEIEITINLSHYSEEEIENHISAYYSSLNELKEIYGEDSEWIIAECIFEQESGLY
jgi:hypothetical protein